MFSWVSLCMIVLFGPFIIALACLVAMCMAKKEDFISEHWEIIMGLTTFVPIVLYLIVSLSMWPDSEEDSSKSEKIYYEDKISVLTLQDNVGNESNINATFVLGFGAASGNSSEVITYFTMPGDDKNGYFLTLFFDENENPYVQNKVTEVTEIYKENWFYGGLVKPIKTKKYIDSTTLELHVPKDTLKVEYSVDLK